MAKATPIILSFNGGELNPKVDCRSDLQKYYSGCRTLENFIPLVEGPAIRCPGTYFGVETKDSSKESRTIPFSFSTTQAYVFEFGDQYIRVYKDNGQVVIDDSMSDFDPSSAFFVGEYCKVGTSVDISFAGSKHLYISAPYGLADSDTVKIAATTNGADTLSVTAAGDTITIAVANATGSKNAANLVQAAIRALGTVNGVSVAAWCATENAAYAAARPITATLAATLMAGGEEFYQCSTEIFASAANTNFYPPGESSYWDLVTEGDPVEIATPWLEADLFKVKSCQDADIIYFTHPSYVFKKLTRTSHIQWELSDHVCKTGADMGITGISQASTAVVTCTDVPTTLVAGDIVYIENVVGMTEVNHRYFTVGTVATGAGGTFELSGEDSTGHAAYVSGGDAYETIYGTTNNNPACATFFEQRMASGGTNNHPQRINLSVSADETDYTQDATDDSAAIQYTIKSTKVDRVYWLIGFDFLVAGTPSGIWKIGASSSDDPVTATNISAKKQVTIGSKDIVPEVVSDALLWVSRSGLSLYQYTYSLEKDKFVPINMTRIAQHITKGSTKALSGIVDMDFFKDPLPILYAVRADGVLLGMTFEQNEQVFAWFRVVTDGAFESVAVISNDDEEDQIWTIVNRTIDGSTKRYVEYFKPIEFYSDIEDCFFVHSGLTWDGGATATITAISKANPCVVTLAAGHEIVTGRKIRFAGTGTWLDGRTLTAHSVATNDVTVYNESDTSAINSIGFADYSGSGGTMQAVKKAFTGLGHLEGETITALSDGAVMPSEVVSSGSVTLDYYGNKVHIGLLFTSTLEPMKISAGSQLGSPRGKKQKITKATICFFETCGGKIGPDSDNLKTIPFGTGVTPTLSTDDYDMEFDGTWDSEATITIVQDQPMPMTVLAIVPDYQVNE